MEVASVFIRKSNTVPRTRQASGEWSNYYLLEWPLWVSILQNPITGISYGHRGVKIWQKPAVTLNARTPCGQSLYGVAFISHTDFMTTFILKVAQWKKRLCTYSKIWIFPPRTENQVLVFVRKENEFFTAKNWLSWLPVTQKLRKSRSEKGKHSVTGKENSNFAVCWELCIIIPSTEPPLTKNEKINYYIWIKKSKELGIQTW